MKLGSRKYEQWSFCCFRAGKRIAILLPSVGTTAACNMFVVPCTCQLLLSRLFAHVPSNHQGESKWSLQTYWKTANHQGEKKIETAVEALPVPYPCAQTWHLITAHHLLSDLHRRVCLNNGNLLIYQFSLIKDHHCPETHWIVQRTTTNPSKSVKTLVPTRCLSCSDKADCLQIPDTDRLKEAQDLFFCILLRLLVTAAQQFN